MENYLYLSLFKNWFDQIAAGTKTEEYRKRSDYWRVRLFVNGDHSMPKMFDKIYFRNGYHKTSRRMLVNFKGIRVDKDHYTIILGKVTPIEKGVL